jgi:hypothetical protein
VGRKAACYRDEETRLGQFQGNIPMLHRHEAYGVVILYLVKKGKAKL